MSFDTLLDLWERYSNPIIAVGTLLVVVATNRLAAMLKKPPAATVTDWVATNNNQILDDVQRLGSTWRFVTGSTYTISNASGRVHVFLSASECLVYYRTVEQGKLVEQDITAKFSRRQQRRIRAAAQQIVASLNHAQEQAAAKKRAAVMQTGVANAERTVLGSKSADPDAC